MKTLAEWLKENEFLNKSLKQMYELYFHREPIESIHYNQKCFYSPVCGIILYSKIVKKDDKILEIKGKIYNLSELLFNQNLPENQLYYVLGIFLTFYDIHYVKCPINSYLKDIQSLPPIKSYNMPMLAVEQSILKEKLFDNMNNFEYLFNNERHILTLVHHKIKEYYIVEIADKEVDCILHFNKPGNLIKQRQNLSFIRFGSQVDIIIPYNNNFKILIPENLIQSGIHIDYSDLIIEIPQ